MKPMKVEFKRRIWNFIEYILRQEIQNYCNGTETRQTNENRVIEDLMELDGRRPNDKKRIRDWNAAMVMCVLHQLIKIWNR